MASSENNVADQNIEPTLTNDIDKVVNLVSEKSANDKKGDQFEIGDIIWAKLGTYPFWPSIVCLDPELKTYISKGSSGNTKSFSRNTKSFSVHVRFCNDNGRRSWVNKVEKYFGKDDFLLKHPKCMSGFKFNNRLEKQWNAAITEATHWLTIKRQGRLIQFFNVNNLQMDVLPSPSTSKILPTDIAVEKLDKESIPITPSTSKILPTNIAVEKLDMENISNTLPSTSKIAIEKLDVESMSVAPSTSKIAVENLDVESMSVAPSTSKIAVEKYDTITVGNKKPVKRRYRKKKVPLIVNDSDDNNDDNDIDTPYTVEDEEKFLSSLKQSTLRVNRKRLQEIQDLEAREPDVFVVPRPVKSKSTKTSKCRNRC